MPGALGVIEAVVAVPASGLVVLGMGAIRPIGGVHHAGLALDLREGPVPRGLPAVDAAVA